VLLPWDQLRLVLAVGRHGTLSGAARALGTSADALDAELKAVERAAGAALFVREDGQLLPTDAGRSALRTGERMAEEMARVGRALPPVPPGPPVRVGLDALLAERWLRSAGADLARWLGPVTLELVTGRGARGARVDLEVSPRRPATRPGSARALGRTGDALYASEGYLLDHGRPMGPDRLDGHRIVLLTGAPARSEVGRWLQRASKAGARVALLTDGVESMLAAVVAGAGLGVLPRGSEEVAPELVRIAALPEIPVRSLWLVPAGGRLPARVRRAADVLERSLGAALRRWEHA
jgi:DNA-binding transcriptional LysR family regulator